MFWPASGIAAGILIITGRRAATAIVLGVVIGTVAANIMSDRNLLTSIFKGICNAGEAVLVAWLLDRWFGRPFTFDDLRRVAGFLAAAVLATATSAIGGAATMTLFHTGAPFWDVWQTWFLSDGVGIVVVAPIVIAFAQMWREQPSRGEVVEGAGVLALMILVSLYVVNHPTGSWLSFSPGAVVLPLLLWLTARCKPTFPIAGAFIASSAVICAITFGMGRFGDPALPIIERVKGAQAAVTMVTIYTLVLIALFAERRRGEVELKQSNNRLQLALDCAQLGSWSLHLNTDRFENDVRDRRIHGYGPEAPPQSLGQMRSQVHPDDLSNLDAAFMGLRHGDGNCRTEYRLAPLADQERTDRERWVALEGTVVRHANGQPAQLLGVTRDITERKQAEQALAERNLQLALAGKAGLVGTYSYDANTEMLQVSEGYAAIHGFPEGTTKIARSEWLASVHPEDVEWLERRRSLIFRQRQAEYNAEFRIVHLVHGVRWIEARSFVSYDADGNPLRVVGVNIDITQRKQAEEHRKLLNAELDHRVKNALATVSAVVSHTSQGSISVAHFEAALEGRLRSMATTHELLSARGWRGISLIELVRREVAPYTARNNVEINGADVVLTPEAGQAVAMVLHELATNAAKYGALSAKNGRVSIRWDRRPNGQPTHLVFEWQEIGGPPVVAPSKTGYGTSTIRDLIPYEFGGAVDLVLAPEGVRCRVELPAEWLSNDGSQEMKAHRLIDGETFGPKTLKAMGEAFDQAWAEIAKSFGDDVQIENARTRLAEAMLLVATEGSTDVAALKAGALQAMALDHRSGIEPHKLEPSK